MKNYIIAAIVIIIIIGGIIWYKNKANTPVDNGVATTTDTTAAPDVNGTSTDTVATTTAE
jgi:uncharacterized protein YoxC